MYLIEDSDHKLMPDGKGRKTFQSLDAVHRPDGGLTTKAKVGDLYDEQDRSLKICEAVMEKSGSGSYFVSRSDPEYKSGKWVITDTYSEPPTVADPTEKSDPEYADNFADYRRAAYEQEGVTTANLAVALWEKLVESRDDGAADLQKLRDAVKKRFPKPSGG
tara:strand:- start:276 stop:761 length:486 start_codon:yes stop_codon:yes gene_type:complete